LTAKINVDFSFTTPSSREVQLQSKGLQDINFSQTQQFITQNIFMATSFDSIESSSGLPKNRSNVSKFNVFGSVHLCTVQ
jgi:hypothetical protein